MEKSDYEETRVVRRRRILRLVSIAGGLAIAIVAVLAIINLAAGKADGASGDGDQATAEETDAAGEEGNKKAPVPVQVTEVVTGTISAYITASANLVAENEVKVLSEAEGRVARILAEEGDFVRRGQALATLVRDDAEIGFKKAQFKEGNARRAFERGEGLVEKELISSEEFDKFTMDFELAQQELAEAEWVLEKTTIRAPFDGRVSERIVQPGQHVRPGDELFQVTDFHPLIARIYLPERDVLGLREGREVRIRLTADEAVTFQGRIRWISPVVDTATGTVKVTIEASEPPASVRPGSFVTVGIVRETRPQAVLVPRESVLRELQSAHLFVAEEDKAEKRAVTLGLEEGERVEILTGVSPGDRVIVAGQGGLKDGSPIKVLGAEGGADPAEDAG